MISPAATTPPAMESSAFPWHFGAASRSARPDHAPVPGSGTATNRNRPIRAYFGNLILFAFQLRLVAGDEPVNGLSVPTQSNTFSPRKTARTESGAGCPDRANGSTSYHGMPAAITPRGTAPRNSTRGTME